MGDIGRDPFEIECEPLQAPAVPEPAYPAVPVAPEREPEPVPA